jgi:hypothetical protein
VSQVKLKFIEAMAAVTPVFGALLLSGDKLTDLFAKLQGLLGIANSRASITSVVSGGASTTADQIIVTYSIPANYLTVSGGIRAFAAGIFTKPLSIGTTLSFWVKVDANKIATFTYTPTAAQTSLNFNLDVQLVARSIGASGRIVASGICNTRASLTPLTFSSGTVGAADTTAEVSITIGYTFSNSNASNNVTAHTAIIEMK